MEVHVLSGEDSEQLQSFVEGHFNGAVEQTWAWGELQTRIPGRPEFRVFGVFEDSREGRMVGSMLVIRQEMGFGKSWLWCPRGPLLPEKKSDIAWGLLQEACKNWARLKSGVFLRVEPGFGPGEFELGGRAVKEAYMPGHSLMLDLGVSEEDLLAQMAQKGRYNIKVAAKHGVKVREGKVADIAAFYEVLRETAGRDGFGLHREEFYRDFLKLLGEKAAFYVTFVGEELVGGILMTYCDATATYYFGASSGKHREAMAPYALQWHAISEARKRGCKIYDFLGVAPEGAAGEGHSLSGVTQFKTRFGGRRVQYAGPRAFVYRWGWWLAYRLARFFS